MLDLTILVLAVFISLWAILRVEHTLQTLIKTIPKQEEVESDEDEEGEEQEEPEEEAEDPEEEKECKDSGAQLPTYEMWCALNRRISLLRVMPLQKNMVFGIGDNTYRCVFLRDSYDSKTWLKVSHIKRSTECRFKYDAKDVLCLIMIDPEMDVLDATTKQMPFSEMTSVVDLLEKLHFQQCEKERAVSPVDEYETVQTVKE